MDNLPLLKVVEKLEKAGEEGQLDLRPNVPHLIITGSLEPPCNVLYPDKDKEQLEELTDDWVQLIRRIKMLRFNKKVDTFARAQEDLCSLWKHWTNGKSEGAPISLRVATMKPARSVIPLDFIPCWDSGKRKTGGQYRARLCCNACDACFGEAAEAYKALGTFNLKIDPKEEKEWKTPDGDLIPQPRNRSGCCWFQVNTTVLSTGRLKK